MRKTNRVLALVAGLVLISGMAQAQWDGESGFGGSSGGAGEFMPLSLQDMSCISKFDLSLPLIPAEHYFGMTPKIYLQYGAGNYSLGLTAPMSVVFPDVDGADTVFVFGNLTVDVKGNACTGGPLNICYGGSLAFGFGFIEMDDLEDLGANMIGIAGHQDWTYHLPEAMIVKPLGTVSVSSGPLYAQLDLGPSILVPLLNTEYKDTEVGLVWQFGVGAHISMFMPMLEFKGFTILTADEVDSQMWINLGARVDVDGILPSFFLTLPLNDESKVDADVQIVLGVAARF